MFLLPTLPFQTKRVSALSNALATCRWKYSCMWLDAKLADRLTGRLTDVIIVIQGYNKLNNKQ